MCLINFSYPKQGELNNKARVNYYTVLLHYFIFLSPLTIGIKNRMHEVISVKLYVTVLPIFITQSAAHIHVFTFRDSNFRL